jgi:alpha-L-rhamnosidase
MRFAALVSLSAVCAWASVRPVELRVDYRTNPAGIDDARPRLSWQLEALSRTAKNLKQSAYQVEVRAAGTGAVLWDSGKVGSGRQLNVEYAGQSLASGMAAEWRVRVWDQDGKASVWSAPGRWSMGLLKAEDWKGKWIGLKEAAPYQNPNSPFESLRAARWIWTEPAVFRASFTVPRGARLQHAWSVVYVTRRYQVTVNGNKAASGRSRVVPDVVDVAAFVHEGENELAIDVTQEKKANGELIAALKLEFENRAPMVVATSPNWSHARDLGAYGKAPQGEVGFEGEHALAARALRTEFDVTRPVKRAVMYVSGLGLSELYLNGAKVSADVLSPALSEYQKRAFYVTHDVTAQLKRGRNAVGLLLGNGRYWAPRVPAPADFGPPKAMAQLEIEYADGTTARVVSDGNWRASAAGPIRANNEYDGEEYDARREMPGWSRAGFPAAEWKPVDVFPASTLLVAQMMEPIRVRHTLKPVKVTRLRPGVWVFDMGQNLVGWCRLHVSGKAGTRVVLRHSETLNPDGSLYVANLRTARATDLYTLKGGGAETWEPRFTYHGFRYVEVTGYPGTPGVDALEGRVVYDNLPEIADFTTSSEVLNAIHRNTLWGFRGNYRSIPTDCPQRDERQGWLGDRSLDCLTEAYLFEVAPFYEKWMQDIADSQKASGSIPDVAPTYWAIYNDDVTWPATFFLVHEMLWNHYGDRRAIERDYPAMRLWMEHMSVKYLKDGLMPKDTYGDWCVPPEKAALIHSEDPARRTDPVLIGTAYFYHLLRLMTHFAPLAGHPEHAAGYAATAAQMREAFNRKFLHAGEGYYSNGTQTSSVLALQFGLVPEEQRSAVLGHLVRKIASESRGHVGVGLLGAQWITRLLSEEGRTDVALGMATQRDYPSWGYMTDHGATTIWELWNGNTADPAMNSGNHVMLVGDLGAWMYGYLGGLLPDPERPAFEHAIIRPRIVPGLDFVRASHRSPYGLYRTAWKRQGKEVVLEVTVPPNASATVQLPGQPAVETGSGTHVFRGAIPRAAAQ